MSETSKASKSEINRAKMILIVEDDVDIGDLIVQAITSETPYQPILAYNSYQALQRVMESRPHLFVLDYMLPDMNGLDLYDHLHETHGLESVPALFMSANIPTKELEKRQIYYVRKPFELDELLFAIDNLLT